MSVSNVIQKKMLNWQKNKVWTKINFGQSNRKKIFRKQIFP